MGLDCDWESRPCFAPDDEPDFDWDLESPCSLESEGDLESDCFPASEGDFEPDCDPEPDCGEAADFDSEEPL